MKRLFATLACLFALCAPARALTQDDVLSARILPGYQSEDGQMAGILLTLTPGWKTYWRAPGEAGIPPFFDWSGSQNVQSVRVHWPAPSVFHTNGIQTIGYHDEVLLPLEVTPVDPGEAIVLRVKMDLGICKDICMPARLDLGRTLDETANVAAIKAALRSSPKVMNGLARCEITLSKHGLDVTASIKLPSVGADEVVAIETADPALWVGEALATRQGGTLTATATIYTADAQGLILDRSDLRITILSEGRAVEINGCPAP
jgi:DsbC/DsbD-like thiol-disulfide interchange protein